MRRIPPSLCARCKGYKKLCGLSYCPILARFKAQAEAAARLTRGRELDGSSPPSIIVGEKGYPKIPIIYHVPPGVEGDEARFYDDPLAWKARRVALSTILQLRSRLVGALSRLDARNPWTLYENEISLAAVSQRPVDTEARLSKPPVPSLSFDGLLAPQGPLAPAEEIRVSSNPRLHRRLESLIWDDVAAAEAVYELYMDGVNVYTLIRALSLGLLGRRRSRRLVPTRWAITAVDDMLASRLLRRVRSFKPVERYMVFKASYLGNEFTIILMPGSYEAELYEVWHPLTPWTMTAKEPVVYKIRETRDLRVEPLDGGYMALRLPVAEYLYRSRRQASVLAIREITRSYYAPVGNWHIRETVREAMAKGPVAVTDTLEEAIEAASQGLSTEARRALGTSALLKAKKATKTLDLFLSGHRKLGE